VQLKIFRVQLVSLRKLELDGCLRVYYTSALSTLAYHHDLPPTVVLFRGCSFDVSLEKIVIERLLLREVGPVLLLSFNTPSQGRTYCSTGYPDDSNGSGRLAFARFNELWEEGSCEGMWAEHVCSPLHLVAVF